MPRGDKNMIPDFKISIPTLPEQEKIVSKITTLESQIFKQK